MKVPFECEYCSEEIRESGVEKDYIVFLPLQSDRTYLFKCHEGHDCKVVLNNPLFEIVFEIACHAIVEGYYREAIVSYTTCLERFYEYILRGTLRKNGFNDAVIEKAWKTVKKSDEQRTVIDFVYCLFNGNRPALMESSFSNLRNNVVHNGLIPDEKQSIKFGVNAMKVMDRLLDQDLLDYILFSEPAEVKAAMDEGPGKGIIAEYKPLSISVKRRESFKDSMEMILKKIENCRIWKEIL